ncbi:MAG TPA: hemerythrin domain-containing protein [Candidatus Binatia bacterium]|nr:hemerythrin domain-containing protein [Candidatus Binatia bacterium]
MKTKHSGTAAEAETELKKGPVYRFLADDHARLDVLLQRAFADPDQIDLHAYSEFRSGLLKHIAIEEKVLLPAAQQAQDGEPLAIAAKLRIQHGALAALLVPSPTRAIGAVLRAILKDHNPLEEGSGGVYEICERLAGSAAATMLAKLQSYAEIKLAPHNDGPLVMESTRRALARAGYNLEGYI